MAARGDACPTCPGRTWRGAVTFVNPTVEEKTRTVKVRIEVANEGDALKPDMFADVVLRADLGAAPVRPGERRDRQPGDRKLVFLDRGDGRLRAARGRSSACRVGERLRGPLGPRRGRPGRDLGQLPARLRVEPARRRALRRMATPDAPARVGATRTEGAAAHDPGRHPLQRREPLPRPARDSAVAVGYGVYTAQRTSRSTRSPTSPTRRSSSTRAGTAAPTSSRTRSPTRSSPRCSGAPNVKAIRGFSDFGFSLRLRDLRGRHRHLLGAQPRRSSTSRKIQPRLPEGVQHRARARRHRRRLGLPVRARGRLGNAQSLAELRTFQDWTLRYACSPCPASPRWPRSAASCSSTRSRSTRTASRPTASRIMDVAEAVRASNNEVGGRLARVRGQRVHGARPRLRRGRRPTSRRSCCKTDERGTPVLLRDVGQRGARPGDPARRRRPRRPRATRWAASW